MIVQKYIKYMKYQNKLYIIFAKILLFVQLPVLWHAIPLAIVHICRGNRLHYIPIKALISFRRRKRRV